MVMVIIVITKRLQYRTLHTIAHRIPVSVPNKGCLPWLGGLSCPTQITQQGSERERGTRREKTAVTRRRDDRREQKRTGEEE